MKHTADRSKSSTSTDLYTTAQERSWFGVRDQGSNSSPAALVQLTPQQTRGPRASWWSQLESHLS